MGCGAGIRAQCELERFARVRFGADPESMMKLLEAGAVFRRELPCSSDEVSRNSRSMEYGALLSKL
jgi:hypothetical protein